MWPYKNNTSGEVLSFPETRSICLNAIYPFAIKHFDKFVIPFSTKLEDFVFKNSDKFRGNIVS
jgi:hypothetical protein